MKRIATLLLTGLAVSCGDSSQPNANVGAAVGDALQDIRNGDPANGPAFSGVGSILATTTHNLCSGSMISRSLMLTAAQCVHDASPDPVYTFSVGPRHQALSSSTASNRLAVATVVAPHPNFDTPDGINLAFDLAVVRLEKKETRSWNDIKRYAINPVDMPTGVHATGVGFGESPLRPGSRSQGDFLVTDYVMGADPDGNIISDAFLEVEPGNSKDQMICPGDSGGPLLYNGQLNGVASFRFVATCPEGGPGFHVATARLLPWINDNINELDPPGACATEDDAAFATHGGGCEDLVTSQVWSAEASGLFTQADAAAYCDGLMEAGRDDWRLATASELTALDQHLRGIAAGHGDDDGDKDDDDEDDDGPCHHSEHHHAPARLGELGIVWSSTVHGSRGVTYGFSDHHVRETPSNRRNHALCVRAL